MSETINGHTVKELNTSTAFNFICSDCGLETNFKDTFETEECK